MPDDDVLAALRKRSRATGIEPSELTEAFTLSGAIRDELYLGFDALDAGAVSFA